MNIPVLNDTIFGIAIRLSFSLRDRENSSYNYFFKKTLREFKGNEAIFPTNLKIQAKYREFLNRVLFFTPDLSSIYEGDIYDICDADDEVLLVPHRKKIVQSFNNLETKKTFKSWIVIEELKKVRIKDIQDYYVYGTAYSLADKMMEPAFPRIYYTNILEAKTNMSEYYSYCPYCGKAISENFLYCPYCGSSLRIK